MTVTGLTAAAIDGNRPDVQSDMLYAPLVYDIFVRSDSLPGPYMGRFRRSIHRMALRRRTVYAAHSGADQSQ